jgi:hypothetical protein
MTIKPYLLCNKIYGISSITLLCYIISDVKNIANFITLTLRTNMSNFKHKTKK